MKLLPMIRPAVLRAAAILFGAVGMLIASVHDANAASGWVRGNWRFWNENGNYCPTAAAACTGAWYVRTNTSTTNMFNTSLPVSNATVFVQDLAGNVIGQGSTNDTGTYTVQWNTGTDPFPNYIKVGVAPINPRFGVYLHNGNWMTSLSPTITTASSSTSTTPQLLTTYTVGNSTTPNAHFNAYWAGEILWRAVLSDVGLFLNEFTSVQVRGFQDTIAGFMPTSCPNSCTDPVNKRVQLDDQAQWSPQGRIMHELGHIATYTARPWKKVSVYNYDGTGEYWDWATPEFGSAAFEEAMASHYGNMTFWNRHASVTPTTCTSNGFTCYSGAGATLPNTDFELTSFPAATNNCIVNESLFPISAMRFLWDVYDNRNDATGDTYSAGSGDFWQHASLMQLYEAGTSLHQHEDPWNPTKTAVTEPHGRASASYAWNYVNRAYLPSIDMLRTVNCSPM